MATKNTPAAVAMPSAILAMHRQYEAAWEAHHTVDKAKLRLGKDEGRQEGIFERAMSLDVAEGDALRLAILYQVPTTWVEAMVLQYHIYIEQGMGSAEPWPDALEVAIETLFDFFACEIDADHEEIGRMFQSSANLVYERRHARTGKVEE